MIEICKLKQERTAKMQIRVLFGLLSVVCATAAAAELPLDGTFHNTGENGQPKNWVFHPWSGFMPYAKAKVEPRGDGENNILSLREINAASGTVIRTARRQNGISGDTVQVLFRARGKGTGTVTLYYYTKNGGWNRTADTLKFKLTPEWTAQSFQFIIANGPFGETAKFDVCLGAVKGSELDLSSIKVDLTAGKYRGNFALPKDWTAFAPVDSKYQPTEAELNTIPEKLNGVSGSRMLRANQKIDFAPLLGDGAEKCGWVFAELQSPIEADCTLGAGGDWWMQLYVNGEKVVDTMKTGNVKAPVAMDNYLPLIRLKKGRNIIAAKLVTGRASSHLYLAGPNELRSVQGKIKLDKISLIENFDGRSVICSGNPEQIQGYPTPGLLALTGQGVFRTKSALEIKHQSTLLAFPSEPGRYAAMGVRIQNFGQEKRSDSVLSFVFSSGKKIFTVEVEHAAALDSLKIRFKQNGVLLAAEAIPYRVLPADFLFAANANGDYALAVNSLADSSSRCFRGSCGFFTGLRQMDARLLFRSGKGGDAEIVVDNYLMGFAANDTGEIRVPFQVACSRTFDPVKAGWKLVFSDEFNEKELDQKKWFYSYDSRPEHLTLKDGKLVIKADWDQQKTKVKSASIYTHQDFLYGYFEARVKFRKEHGWWSAFWLCTQSPSNAFLDGFEIDIYEDYYLRSKVPGGKPGDTLDHNLHMFAAGGLKSWNYHSKLPGSIDDFYVIGCKWTPFEISYYMNGKLMGSTANHSPYDSVTFDPFHHGGGLTPLKAILSGCCGKSGGDPKNGRFPDEFQVDYVRIYEYPSEDRPQLSVTTRGMDNFALPLGGKISFHADVKPSAKSNAKIKGVYLMDSGFLLDYKTEPPYDFDVSLTKEYYDTTHYVKPGRSGKRIELGPGIHSYSIMVQDAVGQVAYSEPLIRLLVNKQIASTPYQGKMTEIPGRIYLSHYDEGGQNIAYFDTTPQNFTDKTGKFRPGEAVDAGENLIGNVICGEWLNYTVQVRSAGLYQAVLKYGTPIPAPRGVLLLVDGHPAGEIPITAHAANHFGVDTESVLKGIKLTEGKHLLTLIFLRSGVNLSTLEIKPE